MTYTTHPPVMTVSTIIRTKPEFNSNSFIRSVALFTVARAGESDARFELLHRAFDADTSRAAIIAEMAEYVPHEAVVLTLSPPLPKAYHTTWAKTGFPPPGDIQLLQRERQDLDILPVQLRHGDLADTAKAMGMKDVLDRGPVLERARRAPEQAQALWHLYLEGMCPLEERRDLTAAWHAWRTIEHAKPIGF